MEAFNAGTLAGAGSFRCEECGFVAHLHERDEVPGCPNCGGDRFARASLFGPPEPAEDSIPVYGPPEWLEEAREALVEDGCYLAYHDGDRVRIVALQEGWTRLGRSLSAHVRFDDPTVSRRHALVYCDESGARVLDDRSLNGVFVNGDRAELSELSDGDELAVGRFHLYFVELSGRGSHAPQGAGSAVA